MMTTLQFGNRQTLIENYLLRILARVLKLLSGRCASQFMGDLSRMKGDKRTT